MAREHQLITSGSVFEEQIGYSRAVVSDEFVFVSGCTGYDYSTGELKQGIAAQTEQTLQNIAAALARVAEDDQYEAPTMANIVRVHYILPDRAMFPQTWPVLRRWLGGDDGNGGSKSGGGARPAATMIQAGLIEEEILIEIEVTARRPRKGVK